MEPPVLEEYTDLVEIGAGGFGTVYRAWHAELGRQVAVKALDPTWDAAAAAARLQREATSLGRLSDHPNIVVVHDLVTAADGRACLVMPLLEGSLGDRMAGGGQAWPTVVAIGIEIAGALQTAHDEGILHRDLKPDNILFDRYGRPQLADFGIAHVADGAEIVPPGAVVTTLAYAPPEAFAASPPAPPADVYGLAATLVAAIRGGPAFCDDAPGFTELRRRLVEDEPPTMGEQGVPADVAGVLCQAMAKDPGARPPTPMALARLLQACQASLGQAVTIVPHVPRR